MTNVQVAGQVVYVNFSAAINDTTTQQTIAALMQIAQAGASEIYLMVSTPGGQVASGMTLYNVIRSLPIKVTTHNMGNVDSIGNAVFLAGGERYASPHSTFMFHGVGIDANQGVRLEEKLLNEVLDGIRADQKRIGSLIAEHTNLDPGQVEKLFLEARTKDADWALGCGFVDEVRELKIPTGAPQVALVL